MLTRSMTINSSLSEDLSKVTIVVFTKDRPEKLSRALNYYSSSKCSILVMDGSRDSVSLKNKAICMHVPNLDYFHSHEVSVFNRLRLIESFCRTEYLVLSPDDDFILLSTVSFGMGVASGKDLSLAYGDHCGFTEGGTLVFTPLWIWSSCFRLGDSESITERLYRTFCYTQTAKFYWCIYKSSYFYDMIRFLSSIDCHIYSYECAFALYNVAVSKPTYLELPLLVRNLENKPVQKGGQRNERQRKIFDRDKPSAVLNTLMAFEQLLVSKGLERHELERLHALIVSCEVNPLPPSTTELFFPEYMCSRLRMANSPFAVNPNHRKDMVNHDMLERDVAKLASVLSV